MPPFPRKWGIRRRERLDQIIIGTAAQTADAILQPAAGGEHQNRKRILALAYCAQDRQAVAVRQPEIENHGGITRRRDRGLRLGRRGEKIGFVTCGAQTLNQKLRKLFVVLDQQQSHAQALRSMPRVRSRAPMAVTPLAPAPPVLAPPALPGARTRE